jgi:hypothetical protein
MMFNLTTGTKSLSKALALLMTAAACGNSASGNGDGTQTAGTSAGNAQGASGAATGGNTTGGAGAASGGSAQGGTGATSAATTGGDGATTGGNTQAGDASTSGANTTAGGNAVDGAVACSDEVDGSVICRSQADCDTATVCVFNEPLPCGIRNGPAEGRCESDEQCAVGEICEATGEYNCPPGVRYCRPGCTDSSCSEGWACGDDGRCQAVSCEAGYECPEGQVCEPEDTTADTHGCRFLSCPEGYVCDNFQTCDPDESIFLSGCRTLRCDEAGAAECPVNFDCGPATATGSTGCVRRSCSSDEECDCGFCSSGQCMPRGRCLPQPGFCGCG